MKLIMNQLRDEPFELMSLSEVIQPLLESSPGDCFIAMDDKGLFTDGWKMHKGHHERPVDLKQFLRKWGLDINIVNTTKDKGLCWVKLVDGEH